MKKIITLAILIIFCTSFGQTVGFKESNQKVSLSEKTISLKIIINDNKPQKKGTSFDLVLSHNQKGKGIFPNLEDGQKEISIDPNNYHEAQEIKIQWNAVKAKDLDNIVFTLKKKNQDETNFTIDKNFHIVNPYEKAKTSVAVGIINSCCKQISPSFIKDSAIELQFALVTDKSMITKEDKLRVIVGFAGVDDFDKTYEFDYDPSYPLDKVEVKKEEGNNDFDKVKEHILKTSLIILL